MVLLSGGERPDGQLLLSVRGAYNCTGDVFIDAGIVSNVTGHDNDLTSDEHHEYGYPNDPAHDGDCHGIAHSCYPLLIDYVDGQSFDGQGKESTETQAGTIKRGAGKSYPNAPIFTRQQFSLRKEATNG